MIEAKLIDKLYWPQPVTQQVGSSCRDTLLGIYLVRSERGLSIHKLLWCQFPVLNSKFYHFIFPRIRRKSRYWVVSVHSVSLSMAVQWLWDSDFSSTSLLLSGNRRMKGEERGSFSVSFVKSTNSLSHSDSEVVHHPLECPWNTSMNDDRYITDKDNQPAKQRAIQQTSQQPKSKITNR